MTPLDYAGQICYSSREVLQFSHDMARKYKDSPGVYVECGVAAGAQIIAMAAGAPNKTIYAFDSFEGIPLPSNKDNQIPGIRILSREEQQALPNPGEQVLESSGATSVNRQSFCEHLASAFDRKAYQTTFMDNTDPVWVVSGFENQIFIIEGWFEKSIPLLAKDMDDIAILRLDGDLYNSTYVCLKYLYPKVIKAGLVIIDDWALPGCRQAVLDYFGLDYNGPGEKNIHSFWNNNPEFIKDENSTVAYWTK
jgi:hypothetical protein